MVYEKVVLKFNPCAAPRVIQQIFARRIARTLWLAIKPRHVTYSTFDERCLHSAEEIRAKIEAAGRIDQEELFKILSAMDAISSVIERSFVAELLPFINGEKKIAYTIDA